jgi:hypothetical protein
MEDKLFVFDLGDEVADRVTNFTGIVVARCNYLFSDNSYLVVGRNISTNGNTVDEWFTEKRLEEVKSVN